MLNKIGIFLLITSTAIAQDKGQFESYSNTFYGKILKESNSYKIESLHHIGVYENSIHFIFDHNSKTCPICLHQEVGYR